jgi:hypothetical protein
MKFNKANRNPYGGINYGFSGSNKDGETGIAYGLISPHGLDSWIYELMESHYSMYCPETGNDLPQDYCTDSEECPHCGEKHYSEDVYGDEADGYSYEGKGYVLESRDFTEIWVLKSPYFTWAQYCSPCMPGAATGQVRW